MAWEVSREGTVTFSTGLLVSTTSGVITISGSVSGVLIIFSGSSFSSSICSITGGIGSGCFKTTTGSDDSGIIVSVGVVEEAGITGSGDVGKIIAVLGLIPSIDLL